MTLNVAVDIGGTFTDLIAFDEATGQILNAKSSSTPGDLTLGVIRCLEKGEVIIGNLDTLVHGSTVAINTVIERKGSRTALIVTQGTRDVYRIGRGNRPESYNISFKRPEPLVPRHLTYELEERLLPSGQANTPLDLSQAKSVVDRLLRSGAESVAVCLLHSWANPAHEEKIGDLLHETLPDKYVSLSHEILREYGEYERTSTTVLNAYIGPRVSKYIDDLENALIARGLTGRFLIMQSNGGIMSPETAKMMPVAMLESGPVGGFIAAARVGKELGYKNVIALDMGGTTAKTNLIKENEPQLAHGYYIGGYASGHPMMLPVIDTVEIGSGGGSIAWVDNVGSLMVGPQSAGAEPGPICYGAGGSEPTITDANLVLGRLGAEQFLGGEMPLDFEGAKRGIADKVASKLGISEIAAALAITKIAVLNMSLAVRGISVERGYDPRDFAMVAFGGAGALHAVEVARELHIPTVIVPNYPGHFSALGMLMADIQHDYVQTYYRPLKQTDFTEVQRICDDLIDNGRQRLADEQVAPKAMFFVRYLDIRYTGQEFSVPVPINAETIEAGDAEAIREAFNTVHEKRYGYHVADQEMEIVNVRISAFGRRKQLKFPAMGSEGSGDAKVGERNVYFYDSGKPIRCSLYDRRKLAPGFELVGPAIVQEYASTTVMFPEDRASVTKTGEIVIQVGGVNHGQ